MNNFANIRGSAGERYPKGRTVVHPQRLRELYTVEKEYFMRKNTISKELEQLIVSGILGDGSIRKQRKASMTFTQCEKQKDYLFWKYDLFKKHDLLSNKMYPKEIIINLNGKKFKQYRFSTLQSYILSSYYDYFYKSGEKRITRKMLNKLDAFGLAIWYMDDGNLAKNFHKRKDGSKKLSSINLMLNTQSFCYEDHLIIQKYFMKVWNIETKIHKNKNKFRIVMNTTNTKIFIEIIKPYIINCLKYKIEYNLGQIIPATQSIYKLDDDIV